MHDPNQELIAQAGGPVTEHHSGSPADTTGTAAGHTEQPAGPGAAFDHLLGQLGDHREVSFGHWPLFDLPVIFVDNGLHVFRSIDAMQEEGAYTFDHHHNHIYKAGTEQAVAFDLSPTSLVAFQWLAMLILSVILIPMARKYKKQGIKPMRGFFNAVEAGIIYVRDEIVVPNVGDVDGRKLLPIFLTMFFFILTMNFVGLVPGGHTATGNINVTAGLAIIAFVVIQLSSILKNGPVTWLKHLTGGTHWSMWIIMVPVEILGLFTKPFALCIRLFANMTAGHVILLSLIGLVYIGTAFIPVTIGFSLFIYLLELLVAFLQAFIFTMLMAVFTGMGMASHDHEPGEDHSNAGLREHAV